MRVQNSVIILKVSHLVCQESIQEKLFFIKKNTYILGIVP